MKTAVLALALLSASSTFAHAARSPLVGTWVLEHSEDVMPDGTLVPYCTGAHGFIIYTPEGYVSVGLNCAAEGHGNEPADATGRKYSYLGTYRYDGRAVTHSILNASVPEQIGASFEREVTLRGSELVLTGVSNGLSFTATWRKLPAVEN